MLVANPDRRPTAEDALEQVRGLMGEGNPRKVGDISFNRLRTVPQGRPPSKGRKAKAHEQAQSLKKVADVDRAESIDASKAPVDSSAVRPDRRAKEVTPPAQPPVVKIIRERAPKNRDRPARPAGRLATTVFLSLFVPIFGAASRFYFLEAEKRRDHPSQVEIKVAAAFYSYWTLGIGGFFVCRRWAQRGGSQLVTMLGWLQLALVPLVLVGFFVSEVAKVSDGLGSGLAIIAFFVYPLAPIIQSFLMPSWSSEEREVSQP